MFEKFTDRARKALALANQEAQRFNHEYIGTEHILLGLVKEGSGIGGAVLKRLGVDLRKVRLEVERLIKPGPEMVTMGKLPQTPRAKRVVEHAIEEARNLYHNYVGTEHLLLGLLRERDGVACQVLMNMGLKPDEVREEVMKFLGVGFENEATTAIPGAAPSEGLARSPASGRGGPSDWPGVVAAVDDTLIGLLGLAVRELDCRKDEAVRVANYERAAALRNVSIEVREVSRAALELKAGSGLRN